MKIIEPQSFLETFSFMSLSMTWNESVRQLGTDETSVLKIQRLLRDMGQTRFVPLARRSADAMISVPLYAGNGTVIKIIPENYSDLSRTSLFKLPPISVDMVEGKDHNFLIKTYPWLSPRGVTTRSIEEMRTVLGSLGLKFNDQDDQPRNIHRLPDKHGTLTSIDEDIYTGDLSRPELSDAWTEYVHAMFPVYAEGRIAPQTGKTDYSFVSIHDREIAQTLEFKACSVVEAERPTHEM